ncbi:MAG: multicopper oxidase domain-containing protein, partial [Gemmatimonadaceae bacterium]
MRMSLVLAAPLAFAAFAAPVAAQQKPPMKKMRADTGMAGMKMGADTGMAGMTMPIPMPKGMPVFGALEGLVPPITPFLPGEGVNPATLPLAKRSEVVRMHDGDTLDLTATLLRHEIEGRTYVMYGYNGESPGPLIRVPQNATIVVRFHNHIELPSTVHW